MALTYPPIIRTARETSMAALEKYNPSENVRGYVTPRVLYFWGKNVILLEIRKRELGKYVRLNWGHTVYIEMNPSLLIAKYDHEVRVMWLCGLANKLKSSGTFGLILLHLHYFDTTTFTCLLLYITCTLLQDASPCHTPSSQGEQELREDNKVMTRGVEQTLQIHASWATQVRYYDI